ncbi:MAG: GIY-YIG nuclease family protein [Roseiarcus sp.]
MAIDLAFRERAVQKLTNEVGVYVLCDLDQVPIYVGKSTDGIRVRVRRHLTSARSDIIANRQIDVREIAWVWAFPVERAGINGLEALLYHHYNDVNALMNGTVPGRPAELSKVPGPAQVVQVMADTEISEKQDPALRLPRQSEHYSAMVSHFLTVKNSPQIARAMVAHFERLNRYHARLLGLASKDEDNGGEE